jgi:multidrug efflux pump
MRLWLDPVKLAGFGLSATDVTTPYATTSSAAGEVKGEYVVTSINASTELKSAEAFAAALPVKTSGDSRVLLGDVARVEMGAENYDTVSSFDGTPSVYIGIKATPAANPLDVIKEVRRIMPELQSQLPSTLSRRHTVHPGLDRRSDQDPGRSGADRHRGGVPVPRRPALGGDPGGDHPLSMIGVLFFMQMMGYSLNLLTCWPWSGHRPGGGRCHRGGGNIHRHIEEGKTPFDAALEGRARDRHAGGVDDHHPGRRIRPHRADRGLVQGVRPDPGRGGDHFRHRRPDPVADDVRPAAAPRAEPSGLAHRLDQCSNA